MPMAARQAAKINPVPAAGRGRNESAIPSPRQGREKSTPRDAEGSLEGLKARLSSSVKDRKTCLSSLNEERTTCRVAAIFAKSVSKRITSVDNAVTLA